MKNFLVKIFTIFLKTDFDEIFDFFQKLKKRCLVNFQLCLPVAGAHNANFPQTHFILKKFEKGMKYQTKTLFYSDRHNEEHPSG